MKARDSSAEDVTMWTTNQVVFATVFVVCIFLIFWLLFQLRVVLFLLFVAIVLATAIRPAVDLLHRRGVSRTTGVILLYFLIAGFIAALVSVIFPLLADQLTQLSQTLPELYAAARNSLSNSDNVLLRSIGAGIPARLGLLLDNTPVPEELDPVTVTAQYASLIVKGILGTLAVFLLAYYWTLESNSVIRTILRLVPPHRTKEIRELLQRAEIKLGGYIRGQGILCLMVGSAAFAAYSLIGLPFALVLAIAAGVTELFPIFGPVLGAVPAFLVALSIGPEKVVWVVIATTLIQVAENLILLPRVMNDSLGVNPIVILLSMVAFGSAFGLPGVLLALPLAAILQFSINRIVTSPEGLDGLFQPEGGVRPLLDESERLALHLNQVSANGNTAFRELPATAQTEVHAIVQDLHQLLVQLDKDDEVTS